MSKLFHRLVESLVEGDKVWELSRYFHEILQERTMAHNQALCRVRWQSGHALTQTQHRIAAEGHGERGLR